MSDAYGELCTFNEPGLALNIPVAGAFVKWPHFDAGLAGPTDLVEVDAANNELEIAANGTGVYRVNVAWSGYCSANTLVHASIHVNGVRQTKLEFDRQMGATTDRGSGVLNGLIALAVGDVVDLRFTTDINNRNITVIHLDLVLATIVRSI